jgi:hypothetical protein
MSAMLRNHYLSRDEREKERQGNLENGGRAIELPCSIQSLVEWMAWTEMFPWSDDHDFKAQDPNCLLKFSSPLEYYIMR